MGYEKLFNPALQFHDEQEFVDYILTDQPETPFYFAVMKRVNKVGPELTNDLPPVQVVSPTELRATATKRLVIDTDAARRVRQRRMCRARSTCPRPTSCSGPGSSSTTTKPIYLIADEKSLPAQLRSLRSIGIDNVGGFRRGSRQNAGLRTESYRSATPVELRSRIEEGDVTLIDVPRGNGIPCWAHRPRRAPFPRHAAAEYRKPSARTSRW